MTATEALNAMRESGLAMRTQDFYRAWGEVETNVGMTDRIVGLDPTLTPTAESLSTWSVGREGQYMFQVDVMVKDLESGEMELRPYSIMSDQLMTPLEAMAQAEEEMSDNAGDYGERVFGSVMRNIYTLGR